MPIKFKPHYVITPEIARDLMRIEAVKEHVVHLPLTATVLASLRETARLYTTHYSTMIEGNRLDPQQIATILKHQGHFPGREREEHEIKGYYTALNYGEQLATTGTQISEKIIQTLHALVEAGGTLKVKPTPYRDGQNVIRDGRTRRIVYLPPEAKDVPSLMHTLIQWIESNASIPTPLAAAIVHYQFATIHPYYDDNGRTARLLTTLILHMNGYDLKGLYSLEEYYARNLDGYYKAISIGPSHNYYEGRAEADITSWIEYFIKGMAVSFEKVLSRMHEAHNEGLIDHSILLRTLDPKQRKTLELFQKFATVTARQIGELLQFKSRTSSQLCKNWVNAGFLEVVDFSNKGRKYRLAKRYEALIIPGNTPALLPS